MISILLETALMISRKLSAFWTANSDMVVFGDADGVLVGHLENFEALLDRADCGDRGSDPSGIGAPIKLENKKSLSLWEVRGMAHEQEIGCGPSLRASLSAAGEGPVFARDDEC
jgi:hypothetical protein